MRRQIAADFGAANVAQPSVRLAISDEPVTPNEVILRRDGTKIVVVVSSMATYGMLSFYGGRMAAHINWFSQASNEIREIRADLSDGHEISLARYRFSTSPNVGVPITDAYFFARQGYRSIHNYAQKNATAWDDRKDDIVWRGAPNGSGFFSLDPVHQTNPGVRQRLRLAMACRQGDVDFRFVESGDAALNAVLSQAGLIGPRVAPTDWAHMKYAIDIDGMTNAWDNLMQRLALGCCIFKVESQYNFSQWYYPRLIPWEHYIPVKADMSDLNDQIYWARSHPKRARDIAAAGQALAQSMTPETETRAAVEIIENHEARA